MQMTLFSMPFLTPSLGSQAVKSTHNGLSRCDAKPDGNSEQLAACILPCEGLLDSGRQGQLPIWRWCKAPICSCCKGENDNEAIAWAVKFWKCWLKAFALFSEPAIAVMLMAEDAPL